MTFFSRDVHVKYSYISFEGKKTHYNLLSSTTNIDLLYFFMHETRLANQNFKSQTHNE